MPDYLLPATECPPLVLPAALLTPGVDAPVRASALEAGDTTDLLVKFNDNALRLDLAARRGGGAYAVTEGLEVTAAALVGSVSAGQALLDGVVTVAASVTVSGGLADNAYNWIWLLANGTVTKTSAATATPVPAPPAGAAAFLTRIQVTAGAPGTPDYSGRWELHNGQLWRRTGDAAAPGDTPASWAANLQFLTRTAGGTYLWNGIGYVLLNARQVIDGWYEDNVPAGQAPLAIPRYAAGPAFANSWIAFRAGYISGVLVKSNAARVAGTLTVEVYKNGIATGLQAILDGTNTTFKGTAQAPGLDPFVPGDQLSLYVSTDGSWSPVSADIGAALEVEY